jgi:hypothetical protein
VSPPQIEVWEPTSGGWMWGIYTPRGRQLAEADMPMETEAMARAVAEITSQRMTLS